MNFLYFLIDLHKSQNFLENLKCEVDLFAKNSTIFRRNIDLQKFL